jgi:eukaryotic-like serine/threonine-protein kinase
LRAVFGPFCFDLATLELAKFGVRLRLEEKPARILACLIEDRGEVVSREQLRSCLWEDKVTLDFEHGLNKAVNKLRSILSDDAGEPRYIETLSRRGYRFIGAVDLLPKPETAPLGRDFVSSAKSAHSGQNKLLHDVLAAIDISDDEFVQQTALEKAVDFKGLEQSHPRSLRLTTAVFACIVLLAGLAAGLYYHSLHGKRLTEQDTIVLADFDNKTGDAVFDDALKQALAVELEQSPFLNVISDRKLSESLRLMGHAPNERITMEIGRDLCFRTGSQALLGGTIASLGSQYVINIKAIACSTGDILAKEQVAALGKGNVLSALSRACSKVRAKLGESLASVEKYDVPMQVTTSSLEALRSYSMGIKVFREKGNAPSMPFFERAIDLDPNFPMAYVTLAIAHGNQGEQILPAEYAKRAYQLRDRATELEKFRIDALYFSSTGEVEKENQSYELCIANYPRDFIAHANLGSSIAFTTGENEKALAEYQEALRLAPDYVGIYENLGLTYLSLNRLNDANAAFAQALAHKLDSATLRQMMYYLAFLRGDESGMERLVASSAGQPGAKDLLLSLQSDTEAYYGRLDAARHFSLRAADSALSAGSKEKAALWRVNAALREAELGNTALARQGVEEVLRLSPGRFVKMRAALALARIGDSRRAKTLAEGVMKSNPSYVLLKFYWVPVVDAAIELNRGDATKALADLETASPYESHQLGNLYVAYERGQAYLRAHNGAAAAVEFQKLLDHRGLVINFVTGSLVHLQIARAYAMTGDTNKAKAAYKDFFSLWKNADAGIPILRRAQAEYATLN